MKFFISACCFVCRYQTEGSRGAVKDNSGNGFPIVKLVGYDKPAVLQVIIIFNMDYVTETDT